MVFDKSYFVQSTTSNYIDYREKKYEGLALDLIKTLNLDNSNTIIDYGCATGLLIKELKKYGVKCYGTDISNWAIEFGRTMYGLNYELFDYLHHLLDIPTDFIFLLDVLEHCELDDINDILDKIRYNMKCKGTVIRIPVSKKEGEDFFYDISKVDRSHIQIHTKQWWLKLFAKYNLRPVYYFNEKFIFDSEGVLACLLKRKTIE